MAWGQVVLLCARTLSCGTGSHTHCDKHPPAVCSAISAQPTRQLGGARKLRRAQQLSGGAPALLVVAGKLSNVVREMVTSTALAAASGVRRKQLLVMDEVDGMSGKQHTGLDSSRPHSWKQRSTHTWQRAYKRCRCSDRRHLPLTSHPRLLLGCVCVLSALCAPQLATVVACKT